MILSRHYQCWFCLYLVAGSILRSALYNLVVANLLLSFLVQQLFSFTRGKNSIANPILSSVTLSKENSSLVVVDPTPHDDVKKNTDVEFVQLLSSSHYTFLTVNAQRGCT